MFVTAGSRAQRRRRPTALQNVRTLWGQSFDGTANVSGSLTAVGDIIGGASSMTVTAGTGNSRTLTFQTTTSGGAATTALALGADQSATFAGTVSLAAGVSISGAAGSGGLSLGSMTGATALPTGNLSWTGASTKTVSIVSTGSGSSITITAGASSIWSTSSGTLTLDSGSTLNLGTTNAAGVSFGNAANTVNLTFATTSTGTIVATNAPIPLPVGGRLGLDSNYVSTSDLTAKLVLNWNPGGPFGDRLSVYGSPSWTVFSQSSQLTLKATDSAQTGGSISGTTITGLTSTAQLVPGMTLTNSTGTGTLAAGTVISIIVSATSITVNNAASVNGTLTNLTFKLAASTVYDVILVNDGGTLRLLWGPAWTSTTARASAITTQNGINVNSGAWTTGWTNSAATVPTLVGLLLGTVYVDTTAGQLNDSVTLRGVWNAYNRARRQLYKVNATSTWNGNGSLTYRAANADTTLRVAVVCGIATDSIELFNRGEILAPSGSTGVIGIGLDRTNGNDCQEIGGGANLAVAQVDVLSVYRDIPAVGYHFYQMVEANGVGAGTVQYAGAVNSAKASSIGGTWFS